MSDEREFIQDASIPTADLYATLNKKSTAEQTNTQAQEELKDGDIVDDSEGAGIVVSKKEIEVLPGDIKSKIGEKFQDLNGKLALAEAATKGEMELSPEDILAASFTDKKQPDPRALQNDKVQQVKEAFKNVEITEGGGIKIEGKDLPTAQETANKLHEQSQHSNQAMVDEMNKPPVTFNVDADKAEKFLTSMSKEDREKVEISKTIVVNKIKKVSVPVATRKITSLEEYKSVAPMESSTLQIQVPLPNSGYMATFRGCGSLAIASIVPDPDGPVDYKKRFEFCYKYLITTNIGRLTYDEFIKRTSPDDLPVMIHAILRGTLPPNTADKVTLTCGSCKKAYPVEYYLESLLDQERTPQEIFDRVEQIMKNNTTIEDAKEYHDSLPHRTIEYVELNPKLTIGIRPAVGLTVIERMGLMESISEVYNPVVAMILLYVPVLYKTMQIDNSSSEETYMITDPFTISEILYEIKPDELDIIKKCIEEIKEPGSPVYTIRDVKCPHCGLTNDFVPVAIDSLVFTRARQLLQ